jgi:hypothetical protein
VQEREKRVTILFKSTFAFQRSLAPEVRGFQEFIEPINLNQMFVQKVPFQSAAIDCVDHWFQQTREPRDDRLHLLVKGVTQYFIIQISHKVNQAFLLLTGYRAIGSVEVRHEYSSEVPQ